MAGPAGQTNAVRETGLQEHMTSLAQRLTEALWNIKKACKTGKRLQMVQMPGDKLRLLA